MTIAQCIRSGKRQTYTQYAYSAVQRYQATETIMDDLERMGASYREAQAAVRIAYLYTGRG